MFKLSKKNALPLTQTDLRGKEQGHGPNGDDPDQRHQEREVQTQCCHRVEAKICNISFKKLQNSQRNSLLHRLFDRLKKN